MYVTKCCIRHNDVVLCSNVNQSVTTLEDALGAPSEVAPGAYRHSSSHCFGANGGCFVSAPSARQNPSNENDGDSGLSPNHWRFLPPPPPLFPHITAHHVPKEWWFFLSWAYCQDCLSISNFVCRFVYVMLKRRRRLRRVWWAHAQRISGRENHPEDPVQQTNTQMMRNTLHLLHTYRRFQRHTLA